MRIMQNASAAWAYLGKSSYPRLYFEIYNKFYGVRFYISSGKSISIPIKYYTEQHPINNETANFILYSNKQEILDFILGDEK